MEEAGTFPHFFVCLSCRVRQTTYTKYGGERTKNKIIHSYAGSPSSKEAVNEYSEKSVKLSILGEKDVEALKSHGRC